jgi:predicted ribosome quality control (RQC) complex YloA/Tae2 family protein
MQAMGNTYYAYTHLNNFQGWIELFGLTEEDLIYQKRVLSIVSGAILPIVALGFIKSLVDYIKPTEESTQTEIEDRIESILEEKIEEAVENKIEELEEKIDDLEEKIEEFVDGGDSNETELITEIVTEPVGESIESLNIGRYSTSVEVDPMKIN